MQCSSVKTEGAARYRGRGNGARCSRALGGVSGRAQREIHQVTGQAVGGFLNRRPRLLGPFYRFDDPSEGGVAAQLLRLDFQGAGLVKGERCQVPFSGRQGLRRVFSNPNCATAFDTQGSEPYGLLRLRAYRIFAISSFGWGWFSHAT